MYLEAKNKAALNDMAELNDKIAEREYNKLLKSLRKAKAEAIDSSDGEAATEIE